MTTPESSCGCSSACSLPPADLEERIAFIRSEILPRATSQQSDARGTQFEFPNEPELAAQLRALVDFERECCPSLEWELQEEAQRLTLRVGGLDPASPLLRAVDPALGRMPRWRSAIRAGGLGLAASFLLFCVLPIALVAWLGADVAAGLLGLDNPWIIAAGTVLFGLGLWRWERARSRRSLAQAP